MQLNLALAQLATKLGDVQANLEKHLDFIQQAKAQKADLLLFPELSLTGYVLQDLVPTVAHSPSEDDPVFQPLLKASKDLDIMVGFVDEDDRHRFFIASAYLSGGRVVHVHHKLYLATYRLFDEGRFFSRGDAVRAFDTRLRPRRHAHLRGFLARFAPVPALVGRRRSAALRLRLAWPRRE